MKKTAVDIAIIGAGPSGLFMVFEAGFLGYRCAVIDALPQTGGQLTELYPEKPIYDIPGHPEILAGDLIKKLEQQAAPFAPTYLLGAPVQTLEKTEDGFILETRNAQVTAKVVIIAGGNGMFTPRKPALENLDAFEETSLFYAVRDKEPFRNQEVAIAGGGDSAADWAVELASIARHVHVVHRRADFRAAEATVNKMRALVKEEKMTLHTQTQLHGLQGENGQLNSLTIADMDGKLTTLHASRLLCCFGLAPNPGPFASWGLKLDGKQIATDPITQKTNIDGILAIGDMARYEGKMGLILVGFAEAALAAKTAQSLIDPDKKFRLQYSTGHKPGT
jgi:thioredoxin reductase (NADPH)